MIYEKGDALDQWVPFYTPPEVTKLEILQGLGLERFSPCQRR